MTRITLILCTLVLSSVWMVQAAPRDHRSPDSDNLRPAMQALLNDRQAPQALPALSRTNCDNNFAASYPCANVDLLAFIPLATFSASSMNDNWGWTDPQTGKAYALQGVDNGTVFIDISDPENPVYLGKLPSHTVSSIWHDVKVYDHYALIVSEAGNHGMQVFDLTRLRAVSNPPLIFDEDAHYARFSTAHNIAVNEESGYAYVLGGDCNGGLHMIDIQNPTDPRFAGCYGDDGFTHDAQCVIYQGPDADHQGREICFNSNEDSLTIVDVTDKENPMLLSRNRYDGSGYVHQGWLTADQRYFLQDDEIDEQYYGHNTRTYIWDVSNLDAPRLVNHYTGPLPAIDHNQYIRDGYSFQANYRSGLRILDLANIAEGQLQEVASFDIYPSSDSANYNGAWNVYPFFENGVLIVSGIEQGLYVLQPQLPADFLLQADENVLAVCGDGSTTGNVSLLPRNGYDGSVSLSVSGLPPGVTAQFGSETLTPPGSSAFTLETSNTTPGSYPFTIAASDGATSRTVSRQLHVASGTPKSPTLLTPGDENKQPSQLAFSWADAGESLTYDLQVARDAAFDDVVLEKQDLLTTTYRASDPLPPSETLYWRVRARNACGTSNYSAPMHLTTMVCASPQQAIPDSDLTGVSSDLVLNGNQSLLDLDIFIEAQHNQVGDLIFQLQHLETNRTIRLIDRPGVPDGNAGCSGADIAVYLDDSAGDPIENVCLPEAPALQGYFRPQEALSTFAGEQQGGTWRLTAIDAATDSAGFLVQWCVDSTVSLQDHYLPLIGK